MATEENVGDKRLVQLEFAREADVVASPDLFNLAIAEAILMRISAEQV